MSTGAVSTFAGNLFTGGDNGVGTLATFNLPADIIISSDGSIAVSVCHNGHRVRHITISTALVTTLAGDGVPGSSDGIGTSARFSKPTGVCSSHNSNIFALVTDSNNNAIRKIVLSTKVVTRVAGSGTAGASNGIGAMATFSDPNFITLSSDDSFAVISEYAGHRIRKFVLSTGFVTTVAGSPSSASGSANGIGTLASFTIPSGLLLTSDNLMVYVADRGNNKIRRVDLLRQQVSTLVTVSESAPLNGPVGLSWLSVNSLPLISCCISHSIWKLFGSCDVPTLLPSSAGVTSSPTAHPGQISVNPTVIGREPTGDPSNEPSSFPTEKKSNNPNGAPSSKPSGAPTGEPNTSPVQMHSGAPSGSPSNNSTVTPTIEPVRQPSRCPGGEPFGAPACLPVFTPTFDPSRDSTELPSNYPTGKPTDKFNSAPTGEPTRNPYSIPSDPPTESRDLTNTPSFVPTRIHTNGPALLPTNAPTASPIANPTYTPTSTPTRNPTIAPTFLPSTLPTRKPTAAPATSNAPSILPEFHILKVIGGSRAEYARAILVDSDWGSIIAGYDIGTSAAEYDGFMMKLDACGNTLWSKSYGGGLVDSIRAVTRLTDGSIGFVGQWTDPTSMTSDVLFGRVDSSTGNLISSFSLTLSSVVSADTGLSSAVFNEDGSVMIAGTSVTGLGTVGLVCRVRVDGSVVWSKSIGQATTGERYQFKSNSLVRLVNGDFLVVGSTSTGSGVSRGLVTRLLASSGDAVVSFTFGLALAASIVVHSVTSCRDGGYLVLASTTSTSSEIGKLLLLKFDQSNDLKWSVRIDSAVSREITPERVIRTNDDGYVIVGTTTFGLYVTGLVMKVSSVGALEWAKTFGKGGYWKDYVTDVVELPGTGGFRMVGYGYSYKAGASSDVFIAQIGTTGNLNDNYPTMSDSSTDLKADSLNDILSIYKVPSSLVSNVDFESKTTTSVLSVNTLSRSEKVYITTACDVINSQFTNWPTHFPTTRPSSSAPTADPTSSVPTTTPSEAPSTSCPTSSVPTGAPSTTSPSSSNPTDIPSAPTCLPTARPTILPGNPTPAPTLKPSAKPTFKPSFKPTVTPTNNPTYRPNVLPSLRPTASPTTSRPTRVPTNQPTIRPTETPTRDPTPRPSRQPSHHPTTFPTLSTSTSTRPTQEPTLSDVPVLSIPPTSSPTDKADARGANTGLTNPYTNAFFVAITVTTLIGGCLGFRSYLRWHHSDRDYTLVDFAIASIGSICGAVFVVRKRTLSNSKDLVAAKCEDLETGEMKTLNFYKVEVAKVTSDLSNIADGNTTLPNIVVASGVERIASLGSHSSSGHSQGDATMDNAVSVHTTVDHISTQPHIRYKSNVKIITFHSSSDSDSDSDDLRDSSDSKEDDSSRGVVLRGESRNEPFGAGSHICFEGYASWIMEDNIIGEDSSSSKSSEFQNVKRSSNCKSIGLDGLSGHQAQPISASTTIASNLYQRNSSDEYDASGTSDDDSDYQKLRATQTRANKKIIIIDSSSSDSGDSDRLS